MKTSNKLLIGMYLFIIILLFSSFILIKIKIPPKTIEYKETYFMTDVIDSLIINNVDKVLVKTGKNSKILYNIEHKPDFIFENSTLKISGNKRGLIVELANPVKYMKLDSGEFHLDSLNQNYLKLKSNKIVKSILFNSKIDTLEVEMVYSNIILRNSEIKYLRTDIKFDSRLDNRSMFEVTNISGNIDSTSYININKVKSIDLNTNGERLIIRD